VAEGPGGGTAWWSPADVERWAAEARVRDAADARLRERWLRRQAEEEATLGGLLLDLAERVAVVVVSTTGGRRHRGRLEAVGADFLALRTAGDRLTLVARAAVASLRPAGGEAMGLRAAADDRVDDPSTSVAVTLADVLAHEVEHRPRVHVHAGATSVAGELRSVGADVMTLYADGDPPGPAYVNLPSVSEISLLGSG
jgi:hypothetical protein